jgi:hypothetical protein
MAVPIATVVAQGIPNCQFTVIAIADADVGPTTITHNLNQLGYFVVLTSLSTPGTLAQWFVSSALGVNSFTITKSATVGSGQAAVPQVLVQIIPYNLGQILSR